MKETQTFVIDERGRVTGLYNESAGMDVRALGTIVRADKISDVKFNPKTQLWEAIDRKSKKVIAKDQSRKACVRKEHAYYEKQIARGRAPWMK